MEAQLPLVSVIVATNRVSPYFGEALASVEAQTWPRTELVVVDDGSPDPEEIVRATALLGDVRTIRQAPAGVSVARNVGLARARGEFVAFLDDDDRWDSERLAVQVSGLLDRPDAVVSYCGMRTIDGEGTILAEADQTEISDRLDVARRRTGIICPNVVVRRDALLAMGGFHAGIRLGEDLDLMLRLAERGPFLFEPRALVDYRAHGSNTTRRHRELVAGLDGVLRMHRTMARVRGDEDLAAALGESLRKNRRFAWWAAGRAARGALGRGRPREAVGELVWALRTAPAGLVDGLTRRLVPGGREEPG